MAVYDVELKNVVKEFPVRGADGAPVRAVDDVSLQIADGEFFALLGPSGCGKTTTLRMLAGFEDSSSGEILIRGKAVQHVPPFHRPVNTVFQDYALFPHMSVLKNVMFGLEMEEDSSSRAVKLRNLGYRSVWIGILIIAARGFFAARPNSGLLGVGIEIAAPIAIIAVIVGILLLFYSNYLRRSFLENVKKRAMEALELVQLPHAASRKVRQLSGGQQQRVALARALVKKPQVLLLDEPLGALDLKLRKAMQFELKAMQQKLGITFVFVTHDQEEAMTMADRIAVMDRGKVLQVGTPEEIYETPANQFVADFIGETNFVRGTLVNKAGEAGTVRVDDLVTFNATLGDPNVTVDTGVTVAIRPERINLFPSDGTVRTYDDPNYKVDEFKAGLQRDSNINLIEGTIHQAIYIGTDNRYEVLIGQSTKLVVRVQNLGQRYDTVFQEGQRVNIFFDTASARVLKD